MKNEIGSIKEWRAEISRGPEEYTAISSYPQLRSLSRHWLKEGSAVRFSLERRASGRALSYPVELVGDHARVNLNGDLITFGDAVCIMQEKLEEADRG